MKFQQSLLFTFTLIGLSLCAPTPKPHDGHDEPQVPQTQQPQPNDTGSKFIVTFRENTVNPSDRKTWLSNVLATSKTSSLSKASSDARIATITKSAIIHWNETFMNGIGATLDADAVEILKNRDEVERIEPDSKVFKSASVVTQGNAPWGLARLSNGNKPLTLTQNTRDISAAFPFTFSPSPSSLGQGVNVYIIDTGVREDHKDFGGRVTFLQTFGQGTQNQDIDGHGTHVAGTAAGAFFGVAKMANVFALKVLGDDGSGDTSDIISALQLVLDNQASQGNRPAVINMSLGGNHVEALDRAVKAVIDAGVTVVVAAGNDGRDVGDDSPADVQEAITVGATNINDAVPQFSNFGAKVDIFAPGQRILSLSPKSDKATAVLSGTSMATPHITGLVATLLSADPTLTPAQVKAKIISLGVENVLDGALRGSVNLLSTNGV